MFGLVAPATASPGGIDGIITNAHTGEPIANAQVVAYSDNGWAGDASTDESGHYEISSLPEGEYRLRALAYQMIEQWAFGKADSWEADPVPSPGTASFALTPIEYGSLSGRFQTASGAPIANSLVQVYRADQNQVDDTATDANGEFHFPDLVTGGYKLLFTRPGGSAQWAHQKNEYEFDAAQTFEVHANQDTSMTEVAFPAGNVEITVVDGQTAEPIADACVSSSSGPQFFFGCTDADGKTRFENVRIGTYTVSISPPDGYNYGGVDDIVVTDGQTTTITGDLLKESVLRFTVRDAATGEPVADTCVSVVDEETNSVAPSQHCSDADGTIRLGRYWAGRYRVFAYVRDGSLGAQWVGATGGVGDPRQARLFEAVHGETTEIPIKLDGAGSITGTVRSANGDAPVEGVCASVTPVFDDGMGAIETLCSQTDGQYRIDGLGPYQWPVEYPDMSGTHAWVWSGNVADRFAATPVAVQAGGSTTADARLPLAGKVVGTVLGADLPNQYVTVVATNTRTGDIAGPRGIVRGAAEYELRGLATQKIWIDYLGISGTDVARYPRPVPVVAGRTRTLDLPVPD